MRYFFEKYPAGAFVFYTSEDMSSTSSFGCWETLYFYIQANSVNIKTSSWFFCWSCKNFLSYNLIYIYLRMLLLRRNGQKDPLKFLSHFFCLFFLSSYTISSFFLLWRHFHMIRWLQTITRMENEWNEHNRRKKKWRKYKKKIDVHFSHKNAGAIVYGIHDGYKILPQLLWYSLPLFFIRHLFLLCTLKALFRGRVKLTRLLRWNIRVKIDDDFAFIIIIQFYEKQ